MYPPIICTCGRCIGPLRDLFITLRNQAYADGLSIHISELDDEYITIAREDLQIPLQQILDDLGLHLECCRTRMIANVEFRELL